MPQIDNNNMPQAQKKRSGFIVTPTEIGDKKFLKILLITDENVSTELANWTTKKGNHPFRPLNSNKAVEFRINEGDENVFAQSGMFKVLMDTMNANGYEMNPQMFLSAVKKKVDGHDYPTKEELAFVDTSFDSMMNSMFDQFEKKLDDPVVQQLLQRMHFVDPMTGEFKNAAALLRDGNKSAKNVIFALGQWRSNGRSGIPTFVATATQWRDDYNRYVVNNATRLFLYTPNDGRKMPKREIANKFNMSLNDIYGNAHNNHAANTHYQNHGESVNGANGFHMEVFYDISDTEVIPGMDDLFNEHAGVESNLWKDRWNKKALESGDYGKTSEEDNQAILDAGFENNSENEQLIINGLNVWCQQNSVVGTEVKKALDSGNLVEAVTKYFENDPFFDRYRDDSKVNIKTALLNVCVFSVLNHYGVAPAQMLQAFQKSKDYLMRNKQVSRDAKIALMPFFTNFITMINRNNKQLQAANESMAIENKFKNLWNRIVETEEKNRNVRLW